MTLSQGIGPYRVQVTLPRSPVSRYLGLSSDLLSPHRLHQLVTCSVELADARSQASALRDEGRYDNISPTACISSTVSSLVTSLLSRMPVQAVRAPLSSPACRVLQ